MGQNGSYNQSQGALWMYVCECKRKMKPIIYFQKCFLTMGWLCRTKVTVGAFAMVITGVTAGI